MCGIAGRVNRDRDHLVDARALAAMSRLMVHRGPDGEGSWLDGRVGLCHRRLAIVDRKSGVQPMQNEDGSVWLVYNGEIYNHVALREELVALGHVFRTSSDTEVIVHGYEAWGRDVLPRLLGMFAFALWDRRQETLLLARDRLGIKPLYYCLAGDDLVFASEAKALFCQPDVPCEADPDARLAFLEHRYVPGPKTAFQGVHRLQPGQRLVFADGRVRVERWWDVAPVAAAPTHPDEAAHELLDLFSDAVERRLMGEVPVGVFLSGGIDSSAVAWAMSRARGAAPLRSYAVGFPGEGEGGELGYARLVAQALGTEHREVLVTPQAFEAFLPRLVWHLDEPVGDSACVPLFHLAEAARADVTVVLSGEGSDELLAGYPIYWRMLALERAQQLGRPASAALALLARVLGPGKVSRYLRWASLPLEARYRGVSVALDPSLRRRLFGHDRVSADAEAEWQAIWAASAGHSPLSRLLYADLKAWLPDDLLVKADKMTMASSLELRVPFLDHRLVELAAALPDSWKLRGLTGKWLLRRAFAGKLPRVVLERKKRGFPVPFSPWLRGPLHGLARDRLLSRRSNFADAEPKALKGLLDEHRSGRRDHGEALWALLVYDLWHERFIRDRSWRTQWPKPSSIRNVAAERSAAATSSASRTTGTGTPSPRPT
ncbi:MAG TPA: asparagine synthase (glutamine-hydrolyzing) [Myxococcales bacterium]|nr:asparagine synthase (glutamine-hydrolyzing) [Myxococcales bacterium]